MKKLIIVLVAIATIIAGCNKKHEAQLTINIANPTDSSLVLRFFEIKDTLKLKNGSVSKTFDINKPQYYSFRYGKVYSSFYLAPGNNLTISVNTLQPDSAPKFSGKGAVENEIYYLAGLKDRQIPFPLIMSTNNSEVAAIIDSVFNSNEKYFDSLCVSKSNVSKEFIETQKVSYKYNTAQFKMFIGSYKNITDSTYYKFIDKCEINNSDYLNIPNYRNFVTEYIRKETEKTINADTLLSKDENGYLKAGIKTIENKLVNKDVFEATLFSMLIMELDYRGTGVYDEFKNYFETHCSNAFYKEQMAKLYAHKQILAPGKIAPDFTCVDIDSNKISLADFKGKYVYIDFWATWCGPCRQELPKYLEIQKDYKDKNIVFVSISLDDNKDAWKKVVSENGKKGISLFAGRSWESDAARAYQISGIPTFVLIDRDGKIINAQAERPSSDKLRKQLDELPGITKK